MAEENSWDEQGMPVNGTDYKILNANIRDKSSQAKDERFNEKCAEMRQAGRQKE